MVQPTLEGVRFIDPILSGLSVSFRNNDFFYDKIAPLRATSQKSGQYIVEDHDYWFRRGEGLRRGVEAPYTRMGYGYHTRSYDCYEIGAEKALPDPIVAASQLPHDLETSDVQFLTNAIELELEHIARDAFFANNVWGTTATGVDASATEPGFVQFNASSGAGDPIKRIDVGMNRIHTVTGTWPDSLFIGLEVFFHLKTNSNILSAAQSYQTAHAVPQLGAGGPSSGPGREAVEIIRRVLGVQNLYIGDTLVETQNEGQTSRTGTAFTGTNTRNQVWGKHMLLLNTSPPGLNSSGAAVFWIWDESGNVPWAIRSYRDESVRAKINQIFTWPCPVVLSPQSGYFYRNAIA